MRAASRWATAVPGQSLPAATPVGERVEPVAQFRRSPEAPKELVVPRARLGAGGPGAPTRRGRSHPLQGRGSAKVLVPRNRPLNCYAKKARQMQAFLRAAEGIRTLDLLHGKQLLPLASHPERLQIGRYLRGSSRDRLPGIAPKYQGLRQGTDKGNELDPVDLRGLISRRSRILNPAPATTEAGSRRQGSAWKQSRSESSRVRLRLLQLDLCGLERGINQGSIPRTSAPCSAAPRHQRPGHNGGVAQAVLAATGLGRRGGLRRLHHGEPRRGGLARFISAARPRRIRSRRLSALRPRSLTAP